MIKRHLFIISMLMFTLVCFASGNVNYTLTGLISGDRAVVSLGSDAYLVSAEHSSDGSYIFNDVPEGKHFIKVEASGYNLPAAQTVIVDADGGVSPLVGIKLSITRMSEDDNVWIHSWSEDVSNSGYTTTSHINTPPVIEFLGEKIIPSDVPLTGILMNNYRIVLSDEEEVWTHEYAYRLVETLKTIPQSDVYHLKYTKFVLTSSVLYQDILVNKVGEERIVRISKDAFFYANPFLVNLDGVRGKFYSKRLHHALVNFVTDFGQDHDRANYILEQRFGCSINIPDYKALVVTGEDEHRFQNFHPTELVAIINMFEELPEGFHKTPHLNYLLRRLNGQKHPLYLEAAAVAWCVDNGYIEFMEHAFGGDNNHFDVQRLILHEKTHFLWAFAMSEEIKKDWIELGGWYQDPNSAEEWSTTKTTEFVSAYAHGKNPNEDMAESVAYYLKDPEKLQSRALAKYEFIRDRIMHGTRYISSIPGHLTFEVLNLFPDYDYPGKIKGLSVKVEGASGEDKTVTVDIKLNHMPSFEDGSSGAFTRIKSPVFDDVNGELSEQFYDMYLHPVDENPWHLRGVITVDKHSKSGYWSPGSIAVRDIVGNERFEGRNDYVWNMYINNPLEDTEKPVYHSGSLNYRLGNVIVEGKEIQNLEVSFKVTDNVGIKSVYIGLNIEGSQTYTIQNFGEYDKEKQLAILNVPIPDYYLTGNYFAVSAIVSDFAGNTKYTYFSDSSLDEPIKKIKITTPDPDTQAPELDLDRMVVFAEPTNKEAPDGETLLSIYIYTRDDNSGLDVCNYTLRDPQGINHFNWFNPEQRGSIFYIGDPTIWKKQTITTILPQGSAPGIWGLSEMTLMDKALNVRTYNFVETIIFEPDDNLADYILYSELFQNETLRLGVNSKSQYGFEYTYRVINEDTGEEVTGELNNTQRISLRSGNTNEYDLEIDISTLSAGTLLVIVQIKDETGNILAVKNTKVEKKDITTIQTPKGEMLFKYYVDNSDVVVSSNRTELIRLYSLTGQLLYHTNKTEGKIRIPKSAINAKVVILRNDSGQAAKLIIK